MAIPPRKPEDFDLEDEIDVTTRETKAELEKTVNSDVNAEPTQSLESKFSMFRPSQQSVHFNSGAKARTIRMVAMPVVPLEQASGSLPVPVLHSPTRPVTEKDQMDWRIPPRISNWKNPQRSTIPLDKRLPEVQVNEGFAKLSEAFYLAKQKAREAIKERKEQQLRDLELKAMETLRESKEDVDADMYGANADEQLEKIRKTDRFKPDKAFAGTSERSGNRPFEFEEEAEEADPFGLDRYLTELKKARGT